MKCMSPPATAASACNEMVTHVRIKAEIDWAFAHAVCPELQVPADSAAANERRDTQRSAGITTRFYERKTSNSTNGNDDATLARQSAVSACVCVGGYYRVSVAGRHKRCILKLY